MCYDIKGITKIYVSTFFQGYESFWVFWRGNQIHSVDFLKFLGGFLCLYWDRREDTG